MGHQSPGGGFAKGPSSFGMHDPGLVFGRMGLRPGMRFLDIGCGPGDYAMEAAYRVGPAGRVYALDNWLKMLKVTAEAAAQAHVRNLLCLWANALAGIPLSTDSVQVCLMATMLHQFSPQTQLPRLFAEVKRVLQPGGLAAVLNLKPQERGFGPPPGKCQSSEQIDALMRPLGLQPSGLADLGESYLALYR